MAGPAPAIFVCDSGTAPGDAKMSVDEMRRPNWEYRVEPIGLLRSRVEVRLQEMLQRRSGPAAASRESRPEAEQQLNTLGRDGWELVSLISQDRRLTAVLKRPIAE
jgi:hypothetical protein